MQDAAAANPSAQPAPASLTESIVKPGQPPPSAAGTAITGSGEAREAADSVAPPEAADASKESIRPSKLPQPSAADAVGPVEAVAARSRELVDEANPAAQPPAACLPMESIMPSELSRPSTAGVVGLIGAAIIAPGEIVHGGSSHSMLQLPAALPGGVAHGQTGSGISAVSSFPTQSPMPFVPPLALTSLSSPAADMPWGAAGNVRQQNATDVDTEEQNAGN